MGLGVCGSAELSSTTLWSLPLKSFSISLLTSAILRENNCWRTPVYRKGFITCRSHLRRRINNIGF